MPTGSDNTTRTIHHTIEGQLGDRAKIEIGRGTVYINAGDDCDSETAMLSPTAARALADRLREAADAAETVNQT